METNGNFKKYFDALNKRLDRESAAIGKRFDAIEERLNLQGQLITAMQKTQQALADSMVLLIREIKDLKAMVTSLEERVSSLENRVTSLERRVERLERGQTEIIKMLAAINGLESGKKLELQEVHYDDKTRTLTGTIREPRLKYGRKKK